MSEEFKEGDQQFNYILEKQFQYAFKGDMVSASFITLKEPTAKVTKNCGALKQAFFRAMQERAGDADVSSEDSGNSVMEIQPDDVLMIMSMSNNVDMSELYDNAKDLFMISSVAMIEGETKIGPAIMDKISLVDLDGMIGSYLVNFTLASSLRKMQERSKLV